ncbi:MAG: LAGLIDADG family homing endonuclease, partial [bacterium]|nr:LAGLIDADG family homing endonuclease [bacterium]
MNVEAFYKRYRPILENLNINLIQKHLAEKSLLEYIKQAWSILEPKNPFKSGFHIEAICEHLEAITRGDIRRLIINIPPRHAKSLSVCVFWPTWEWGPHGTPETRWLFSSYAESLAIRDSRKCRQLITSPWYQANWGDRFKLVYDQNAKQRFENDKRGHRIATTVMGVGTGEGGDRVIVDDPSNVTKIESSTRRLEVLMWWDESMSSRGDSPETSAYIIVMQRLHECLLPWSRIMSDVGTIRADEVRPGDQVLTSQGVQAVVDVASRHHKGTAVGIRTYGHPDVLWVTPEHLLLTGDGWKPAGEITITDELIFPVPQGETTTADLCALWTAPKPSAAPKQLWSVTGARGRVPEAELRRLVDEGKSSREIAKHFGFKSRGSIDAYRAAYGIARPVHRVIDEAILDDPEFWWLVGLWLAEGSLGKGRDGQYERVRLTLGHTEQPLVERITAIMDRYGVSIRVADAPSVFQVSFGARQVAQFLALFGVGAHGKHLPPWAVLLAPALLRELFRGYWTGDGCVNGRGEVRVASVSLPLLTGFQRALLRVGVVAGVMDSSKGGPGRIGKQRFVSSQSYELRFPSGDAQWLGCGDLVPRYRQNRLDGSRLLVGIRSIETDTYDGPVYDIETPAHDFLCGLATAHNCDLTGHVLAKETGYEHLCLPARYEVELGNRIKTSLGTVDPRTEEGQPLWPEMYDDEKLVILEKDLGSEYAVAGQMQQRPAPRKGGAFNADNFVFTKIINTDDIVKSVRYWDKAGTKDGGAWTAGVLMHKMLHHEKDENGTIVNSEEFFVVADVVRGQWEAPQREQVMSGIIKMDGLSVVHWVEQEP